MWALRASDSKIRGHCCSPELACVRMVGGFQGQGQSMDIMPHTANPLAWSVTQGLCACLQMVSQANQILS